MDPQSLPTRFTDAEERYRVLLEIGRNLTDTLSLEELYRVIHRETCRVLEASGFYISLYDEATDLATVVFYVDQGEERRTSVRYQGSSSEVIRTGEPRLIGDRSDVSSLVVLGDEHREVTRSAVSVPLRHEGRVLGALSAQSYRSGAYSESDLELLSAIGDLAAVALDNAHRVSELEKRRREAERVEEIGRALTCSLDHEEVLAKIVDATIELVGVDGATVWTVDGCVARVAKSGGTLNLDEGLEWELDDRARDTLLREREPLVIGDLGASPVVPSGIREQLRSASESAVPLVAGQEVRGILTAGSLKVRAFSDVDVRTMVRLASQASVALENARLHSHVRSLSLTDPLTGLPNRRHLMVHMEREIAAARRGRPLAAVLFDLDNFKTYNDSLGHVAGDDILRRVGRILSDETRAMNLAARYGGDEFVSVVSGTDRDGVVAHAYRICDRIEEDPELSRHGLTVSYGIAHFDEAMEDGEALIDAADEALYRVKESRRLRERAGAWEPNGEGRTEPGPRAEPGSSAEPGPELGPREEQNPGPAPKPGPDIPRERSSG